MLDSAIELRVKIIHANNLVDLEKLAAEFLDRDLRWSPSGSPFKIGDRWHWAMSR
jgi:hypothetical protein